MGDIGRLQWIAGGKCPSTSPNGRWCWSQDGHLHKQHESRGPGGIVEKWTDEETFADVSEVGLESAD